MIALPTSHELVSNLCRKRCASRRAVILDRAAGHRTDPHARTRPVAFALREKPMKKTNQRARAAGNGKGRKLRSQRMVRQSRTIPDMTALYLERYLNFGLTPRGVAVGQADHRHRPDRQRPVALQPPSPRAGRARARRHPRGRRHRDGIPGPSDPGDRQAPDRGARPQPRLSRPGRAAVRLSARRRGADHRLRQDHAGLPDGGGDRQHSGHRAVGRPDAERLAQGRAHRLRHHRLEGARDAGAPARSTTRSSWSSWPPRRRRSAIATPWARPRP